MFDVEPKGRPAAQVKPKAPLAAEMGEFSCSFFVLVAIPSLHDKTCSIDQRSSFAKSSKMDYGCPANRNNTLLVHLRICLQIVLLRCTGQRSLSGDGSALLTDLLQISRTAFIVKSPGSVKEIATHESMRDGKSQKR